MASNASGSLAGPSTAPTQPVVDRPQAGPLPCKVGEIGYDEREHVQAEQGVAQAEETEEDMNAAEADIALNGRHPADRSHTDLTAAAATSAVPPRTESLPADGTSSSVSLNSVGKRSLLQRYSVKTFHGLTFKSLTIASVLVLIQGGIIAAWVLASKHVGNNNSSSNSLGNLGSSGIFIHVAFAICTMVIIIVLERCVFRLRAERYAFKHPGQVLPSHRHRSHAAESSTNETLAFAPWNRPPLPTYAAALGFRGTGDVEDNVIAQPPPPAYGNTRSSTLLLRSLSRTEPPTPPPQQDDSWQVVERRASGASAWSLPLSYDESEHRTDVARALDLADALARLEEGQTSASNASSRT